MPHDYDCVREHKVVPFLKEQAGVNVGLNVGGGSFGQDDLVDESSIPRILEVTGDTTG